MTFAFLTTVLLVVGSLGLLMLGLVQLAQLHHCTMIHTIIYLHRFYYVNNDSAFQHMYLTMDLCIDFISTLLVVILIVEFCYFSLLALGALLWCLLVCTCVCCAF